MSDNDKGISTAHHEDKLRIVIKPYPRGVDRSLVLSTILEVQAPDCGSVNQLVDPSNGEQGTGHASEAVTSQKTTRDRERVRAEGRWVPPHPNGVEDGPEARSDGKNGTGNNKALYRVMNVQLRVPNE